MKHLEAIMQTRSYSNNKGRELRESTSQQTDLVCRWKGITPFIIYLQVCFYHLHSFARCIGPAEFRVQVNCTCPRLTLVGMWCKIHVNKQKKTVTISASNLLKWYLCAKTLLLLWALRLDEELLDEFAERFKWMQRLAGCRLIFSCFILMFLPQRTSYVFFSFCLCGHTLKHWSSATNCSIFTIASHSICFLTSPALFLLNDQKSNTVPLSYFCHCLCVQKSIAKSVEETGGQKSNGKM